MKCLFCTQEIVPRDSSVKPPTWAHDPYKCDSCQVRYYLKRATREIVYYYFKYQGYSFKFWQLQNYFELCDERDDAPIPKGQAIVKLRYIPNITPHNVKDKLPMLLTFL